MGSPPPMIVTSREAYEHMKTTGARESHLRLVVAAVTNHPGLTASELDALVKLGPVEVRRRLTDAKKRGLCIQGEVRQTRADVRREMTWLPKPPAPPPVAVAAGVLQGALL